MLKWEQYKNYYHLIHFLLFVNVMLYLVFNLSKAQSDSEKAVDKLSSFVNEANDITMRAAIPSSMTTSQVVDIIRTKYEAIMSVIPANTDKEYIRAKKSMSEKESVLLEISHINNDIFEESFLKKHTSALIMKSLLLPYLQTLREVSPSLYLGGGPIRNLVWDYLHGHDSPSQIADLDIIHYDITNNTKENDNSIEKLLFRKIPNITWSVKNQARMHIKNDEKEYADLNDAISKWPETCTAFAAKLNTNDEIDYVLPYGFGDLYRLIVVPTPHFSSKKHKMVRYSARLKEKNWLKIWKNLRIFDLALVDHDVLSTIVNE